MPDAIRISIPLPPSVNSMYRNVAGKGRVSTAALKQWKHDAGWAIQAAEKRRIAGPFRIAISVPENMRGDVDGRIKAAVDLLVTHKVTPDDRFAYSISITRSPDVVPGMCVVEVAPK